MTRLLLVDDHLSFNQSFAFLLEYEIGMTVEGQAGSLAEARRFLALSGASIDVAVVDLALPDGDGAVLAHELCMVSPAGRVLILTATVDPRDYVRAVEAGAAGVLHKSVPMPEVVEAIRRVAAQEQLLSNQAIFELIEQAEQQRQQDRAAQLAIARLTVREREVLQALAEGCNDKQIARRMKVTYATARTHVANIREKLGVESRLQAVVFAACHGIIRMT